MMICMFALTLSGNFVTCGVSFIFRSDHDRLQCHHLQCRVRQLDGESGHCRLGALRRANVRVQVDCEWGKLPGSSFLQPHSAPVYVPCGNAHKYAIAFSPRSTRLSAFAFDQFASFAVKVSVNSEIGCRPHGRRPHIRLVRLDDVHAGVDSMEPREQQLWH